MTYKLDLKHSRRWYLFGGIFVFISVFIFIIFTSIFTGIENKKKSLDGETKAVYIDWKYHYEDNNKMYTPIYYYEVNGVEYSCSSNISSSFKNNNQTVYYDTNNPERCMTDFEQSGSDFFKIFLIMPIVFFTIGIISFVISIKNVNKLKKLATNGVLVKGIPCELVNSGTRVNNRTLKKATCDYKFPDGKIRNMVSEPLYNLKEFGEEHKLCDLLYDPNNYDNFYVNFNIQLTGKGMPRVEQYKIEENIFK